MGNFDKIWGGQSLFITFEGVEGSGKTTQIHRLGDRLKKCNIPLVTTLEPGGTSIGTKIRQILLDKMNENLAPFSELMLYIADRAQHVKEVIGPALAEGKWVLCDRFFDATMVYQGAGRGQDMELIKALNELSTGGRKPDITFLMDLPIEIGLQRARRREADDHTGSHDRFEREEMPFHKKIREGYLEQARLYRDRFIIIDATLTIEEIEMEIFRHVRPYVMSEK